MNNQTPQELQQQIAAAREALQRAADLLPAIRPHEPPLTLTSQLHGAILTVADVERRIAAIQWA